MKVYDIETLLVGTYYKSRRGIKQGVIDTAELRSNVYTPEGTKAYLVGYSDPMAKVWKRNHATVLVNIGE